MIEEQLNSQDKKTGEVTSATIEQKNQSDGRSYFSPSEGNIPLELNNCLDTHNLVPCDMYRVCDGYDELKCSPQFRNICRKLDDYYWKGEDKR